MKWSIIYLACVLIAQYTATWFIPFPWFGMLSVGTITFGATFTARDYVHRLGRKYVYTMIGIAALASIVETVILGVWPQIIVASIIAIILAETADTEVYHRLLNKSWFVRVISSNAISVPLDTLLFVSIAFSGNLPFPVLVEIFTGEVIAKYIVGLIVMMIRSRKSEQPYPVRTKNLVSKRS